MNKPKIVAITGSTKFKDDFRKIAAQETLAGNVVLTVHVFRHDPEWAHLTEEQCANLDKLFQTFIDMCDELIVINSSGYIGDGTKRDIERAIVLGKPVRYAFSKQQVQLTLIERASSNGISDTDFLKRHEQLHDLLKEKGITSEISYELEVVEDHIGNITRRMPGQHVNISMDINFVIDDTGVSSRILRSKMHECISLFREICVPDLPISWGEMAEQYIHDKLMSQIRLVPASIVNLKNVIFMFPYECGNRVSADIKITNI